MRDLLLAVAEEIAKIRQDYSDELGHAETIARVDQVHALFRDVAHKLARGAPTPETVRAFHATLDARFGRNQEA